MPETLLGNLRRFELRGPVFVSGSRVDTIWEMDVGSGGNRVLLSAGKPESQRGPLPKGYEAAREELEARVKTELATIAARDGEKKVRRADLEAFCRMFMRRELK